MGSWSIALRMAKRDVRRHKGRSALIVIMVALPTMLLTFALVAAMTSQVTSVEAIPGRMGNGVAMLEYPQPNALEQTPNPGIGTMGGETAAPIPGWVEGGSSFENAGAVSRLTGRTAVPLLEESASTRLDGRRLSVQSLAFDPQPGVVDKLTLTAGRLPERAGEILVATAGVRAGLPTSGTLRLRVHDKDVDVTVVGTAKVLSEYGGPSWNHIVTPVPFEPATTGGGWILLGGDPVGWDEVKGLNRQGFTVWSADVLRNPPPASALSPEVASMENFNENRMGSFLAIGGALLLVITTLLVGPAFAVSAARQRRALALAASNGATTAQLRHTVLAQAIVLGVVAAGAGAVLGVAAGWLVARSEWLASTLGMTGPLDVPVVAVLATTVIAMASAVIAALLPARRLGRLDIIGVMKGQSVSPRPSVVVFAIGAIAAALGGVALIALASQQSQTGTDGGEIRTVVTAIALVVGAVMLSPMLLVAIARGSSRLPVALRMATRDAGRQRSRSVPAVAAILAGVAVLTMTLIASGSDEEQRRREYAAQNLFGDTIVYGGSGLLDAEAQTRVADQFRAIRPGLDISPVSDIDNGDPLRYSTDGSMPTEPYELHSVNVVPRGCSPADTVWDADFAPTSNAEVPPCQVLGTNGMGNGGQIVVLTPAELERRLVALDREGDVAAVRAGAVVVGLPEGQSSLLENGHVTVMTGTTPVDPRATTENVDPAANLRDVRTTAVPAVEVPLDRKSSAAFFGGRMLVSTDTATKQGWPTLTTRLTVHDPAGPISQDLSDRLGFGVDDNVHLTTERGYVSEYGTIIAVLLGIFTLLLLVITLTSTALSLAEQENDQATLAALGSGRGTRRVMAAAQAFVLGVIGAVLGVAVGIVPGIALAHPLTAQSYNPITGNPMMGDPILVFPWLILLGFAMAVPAVAAGLAAAGIRKAPNATHRAS
ncbi:ABC transporter permease [Knoellia subterranea]|uniref:ABC transporter permease n=1 Tax=Knoellia subterranea TaxID=184882 RepID=UPI0012EC85DD|nr:ABC transporter permease [Knoellia subterranea]